MTFSELQVALGDRNVELHLDNDSIRFRAPSGALTEELRTQIAAHRETIIRSLQSPSGEWCHRCDMQDWVDEQPQNGRIRTHCGRCGRFIGYRPHDIGSAGKPTLEVSRPPR